MKMDEDVYYCSCCLSLSIVKDNGISYCKKCGCAILKKTSIEEWEKLNKEKYPKFTIAIPRGIYSPEILKYKKNNYYNK